MALRIASAYRTVSTEAVIVVAGIILIHLLALERALVKRAIGKLTPATLLRLNLGLTWRKRWQKEWNSADNGR